MNEALTDLHRQNHAIQPPSRLPHRRPPPPRFIFHDWDNTLEASGIAPSNRCRGLVLQAADPARLPEALQL